MKKYKIFDLDGTLLDSMPAWKNLDIQFLKKYDITPPDNIHEITKRLSLKASAEYFSYDLGVPLSPEEVITGFNEMIEGRYRLDIPMKPYVREYLDKEKEKGTKMCVLTASEYSYVYEALKRLDLVRYFEFIMTCSQAGVGKDKDEVFHIASNRLGGSTGDTAVFEDALHAAETAKRAGYTVVGVYDESGKRDKEKMKLVVDRYIMSFQELL